MKRPSVSQVRRISELLAAGWFLVGLLLVLTGGIATGVTYILVAAVFYVQSIAYAKIYEAYEAMAQANQMLMAANAGLIEVLKGEARSAIPAEMNNPN